MSVSAKHKGTSYVAISLGKCTSGPGKNRFSPCATVAHKCNFRASIFTSLLALFRLLSSHFELLFFSPRAFFTSSF